MSRIAIAVLAVLTLAGPTPARAAGKEASASHPQPSSYAPGPRTGPHVYGSPIETQHAPARPSRAQRAKAMHAKAPAKHVVPRHPTKGQQPAPAPAPR
jgi:hypothetical protein